MLGPQYGRTGFALLVTMANLGEGLGRGSVELIFCLLPARVPSMDLDPMLKK